MPTKEITVYLPENIETDVLRAAKTKKLSASGIIAYAVKQHFSLHPNGVPKGAVRQLARIKARMDKIVRDNATIREAVLLIVRVWLEYTRPCAQTKKTPRLRWRKCGSNDFSIWRATRWMAEALRRAICAIECT